MVFSIVAVACVVPGGVLVGWGGSGLTGLMLGFQGWPGVVLGWFQQLVGHWQSSVACSGVDQVPDGHQCAFVLLL